MSTQRLGIIMHGVTGRMGMNQHLIRSIIAIRNQGGVTLSNGDKVMPDPILIGRNAEKIEALDIKLASAFKPVLTKKFNLLVTQKERALELTDGKPLRGRQIFCMIIDHYQINDKDYKNITDLNNVSLRGDDVLGFITKWDDVLMRFDQTKLPIDEQL